MVTVGLDLHKRYITACALDDAGTVLAEHRRLEPSLADHAPINYVERIEYVSASTMSALT